MSDCAQVRRQLAAYRAQGLEPHDRQAVETHLEECASCRTALDGLQRIESALRAAGQRYDELAAHARLPRGVLRADRRKRWKEMIPMAIAASTLVFVALFLAQDRAPQDEVRALVEQLRSDRIEDRDGAANRLKELGPSAVPELEKASQDPDPEVASRARRLVRAIAIRDQLTPELRKAMPGIEDRLATDDDRSWTEAFLEAGRAGRTLTRQDFSFLAAKAVRGARDTERAEVCDVIFQFFNYVGAERFRLPEAAAEIAKFLADPDPEVRWPAVRTLGMLRAEETAPLMLPLLEDPEIIVRCMALDALGELGAKETAPRIAPLLRDPDRHVRRDAASALGSLGVRQYVPDLLKLAGDEDVQVREAAVRALGDMGATEAVPDIAKLLKSDMRYMAASALASLGAKERIPEILPLLKDADARVRSSAISALEKLGAREAIPEIARLLKETEGKTTVDGPFLLGNSDTAGRTNERMSAVSALGTLGAKESIPELIKALKDGYFGVRHLGAAALAALGAKEAIPAIAELLGDKHEIVRERAVSALADLDAKEMIPRIEPLQQDPDASVREAAAAALARLRAK